MTDVACAMATDARIMRNMTNLLKIAVTAAGGTKSVSKKMGVHISVCSRYINGAIPFPPEKVAWLCAEGGDIIDAKRLTKFLADREAERARAKVIARAA